MEARQASDFTRLIDRLMALICWLIVGISILLKFVFGYRLFGHSMVLSIEALATILAVAFYLFCSSLTQSSRLLEPLRLTAVAGCLLLALVGLRTYLISIEYLVYLLPPLESWAQLESFGTQIAPNTALCYFALGLSLSMHNRPTGRLWPIPILALVVMFGLGMTSIFGYVSGIQFAYHWLDGPQMLLASALIFSSFGILGSIRAFVEEYYSHSHERWRVPVMVALLVAYANIGIFRALHADQQIKVESLEREFTIPVDIYVDSLLPETVLILGWVFAALGLIMSRLVLVLAAQRRLLQVEVERRKQIESELQEAKEQADEASRYKSEFLANMSHEIRAPLQAIIGYAELLRTKLIGCNDRDRALRSIERNGSVLSRLVDRVLDLAKIESGKMSFEESRVDLLDVIYDLHSLFARKAELKGLQFKFELEGSLPRYFLSDPTRLRQILMNLTSNAIKFTGQGHVTVKLAWEKLENGASLLKVWVEDSGIGIPDGQHEKVFDEFTQADAAVAKEFGGTGLGLALSRKLARALGGDIVCEHSQPGEGTCFALRLPLKESESEFLDQNIITELAERQPVEAGEPELEREFLSGKQVLLVDDALDCRVILSHFLDSSGAKIVAAKSGAEAMNWLTSRDFDLICLDIELPDTDGYQLARNIRSSGYHGPLLAMTAHALEEVRQRCLQVGFDDCLSKPVTRQGVIEKIASLPGMNLTQASPACSVFANDALIAPLLPLFLKGLPERLEKLALAKTTRAWQDFFALTHQIKGTASSYGFHLIGDIASELDQLKSDNPDIQLIESGLERLKESYHQACIAHNVRQAAADEKISTSEANHRF